MLCALGLRCVFNARRDAKTQHFFIHKREDPYQNGRMPTHGERMLFLKMCDKNEWVSLALSFSIYFIPQTPTLALTSSRKEVKQLVYFQIVQNADNIFLLSDNSAVIHFPKV